MTNAYKISAKSLLFILLASAPAYAAEPPPPAPKPAKKSEPSGLRGNTLPQCPEGQYVASMICKSAAPGYYLEHGMKYPMQCPSGMTSSAGARQKSHCFKET